eukprot:5027594-Prymnesium_polylepis.1
MSHFALPRTSSPRESFVIVSVRMLWAWREVARRQRGMGAQSTREAAERGQCGAVDWLPPT